MDPGFPSRQFVIALFIHIAGVFPAVQMGNHA